MFHRYETRKGVLECKASPTRTLRPREDVAEKSVFDGNSQRTELRIHKHTETEVKGLTLPSIFTPVVVALDKSCGSTKFLYK